MSETYELERVLDLSDVRKDIWWGDVSEYKNRREYWFENKWEEMEQLGWKFERNFDIDYWRERTAERWDEMDPQTEEEVFEFYRTHDLYIPELSLWTYESNKIEYCRYYYEWFVDSDFECEKFLDYGAGIGDILVFMNQFTNGYYCDVGGVLQDFYEFRMDVRGLTYPSPVRVEDPEWLLSDVFDEELDVVVTNDVIEHVPDPERVVQGLIDSVRPGGYIATQWTFTDHADDDDAVTTPCHLHTTNTRAQSTLDTLRSECEEVFSTWNAFMRLWRKHE